MVTIYNNVSLVNISNAVTMIKQWAIHLDNLLILILILIHYENHKFYLLTQMYFYLTNMLKIQLYKQILTNALNSAYWYS